MFEAIREKRFAKRLVSQLLKSYSAVSARNPGLSGQALCREVLLESGLFEPSQVDDVLWQAEDSIEEWATHSTQELGLRELVHFVDLSRYQAAEKVGTVVSFKQIVYSLVPADQ